MRVAAIDVGTNTVLLLVAERDASGVLRAVQEEATITRLGEGVDKTRALKPEAVARTEACLVQYASILKRLSAERVAVVGTSAMRDAEGSAVLRERVRELFGVPAETISGDEEAALTFRGALSGLTLPDGEVAVFDIGGGSTEVVVGAVRSGRAGETRFLRSFDVGSVRMTERHIENDPPTAEELTRARESVRAALAAVPKPLPGTPVVGIAGTVTTLAAISLRMHPYDGARVHGMRLSSATILKLTFELAALPLAERQKLPGLEPKRADVIVAGAIVVAEVMHALGAGEIIVSDRGVRWGLAERLSSP